MEVPSSKRLRPNQRNCPHCCEIVSYKTYRAHKRLHYNIETDTWFKNDSLSQWTDNGPTQDDDNHHKEIESPPCFSPPRYVECDDENDAMSPPHSEPALCSDHSFNDDSDGQFSHALIYIMSYYIFMPSDSFHFNYHSTTLFYYLKYVFSHYLGDDMYEVWSDYDEYERDNNEELPPNLENEAHPTSHINALCTSLMRWLLGFYSCSKFSFICQIESLIWYSGF